MSNFFWINSEHRLANSVVKHDWFTEPDCINKKTKLDEEYKENYACMKFPDPKSENIDSLIENNFQNISFSIYPKYEYLELEISVYKGTVMAIKNFSIEDCSKVPEHLKPENQRPRATLPAFLPSTTKTSTTVASTVASTVPTTTTTTEASINTAVSKTTNNIEIIPNAIVSEPEQNVPENLKLTDLFQKMQVNLKKAEVPASSTEGTPKSLLVLGSTTVSTADTTRPTLPADWGKPDKKALESTTESAIIATTELLEDLLVLTTQSDLIEAFGINDIEEIVIIHKTTNSSSLRIFSSSLILFISFLFM